MFIVKYTTIDLHAYYCGSNNFFTNATATFEDEATAKWFITMEVRDSEGQKLKEANTGTLYRMSEVTEDEYY